MSLKSRRQCFRSRRRCCSRRGRSRRGREGTAPPPRRHGGRRRCRCRLLRGGRRLRRRAASLRPSWTCMLVVAAAAAEVDSLPSMGRGDCARCVGSMHQLRHLPSTPPCDAAGACQASAAECADAAACEVGAPPLLLLPPPSPHALLSRLPLPAWEALDLTSYARDLVLAARPSPPPRALDSPLWKVLLTLSKTLALARVHRAQRTTSSCAMTFMIAVCCCVLCAIGVAWC